jgi:hypothetical protein
VKSSPLTFHDKTLNAAADGLPIAAGAAGKGARLEE